MAPSQVSAQDIESARVIVVLVVVGIMLFWKLALRMMLAIIAVAAALGLVMLLQNIH